MSDDVRWVDVTVIGSQYEEQLEVYSSKRRYRPLRLGQLRPYEDKGVGEWTYGDPSEPDAALL